MMGETKANKSLLPTKMVGNLAGSVLHVAAKIRKLRRRISPTFRRQHAIRQSMRTALYDVFWQRVTAKIEGSIESMPGGFAKISVGNATTFVRRSQVCLDNYLTLQLAGNKPLVYQLLNDMQITCLPDYCTYRCTEISKALRFLETKGGPMVVKPAAGTGAGAGVTTGISSGTQLLRATMLAASFCNDLLIEKQFVGESYRLLFLNGAFIDAIQRCAPTVVGDGKLTISALVDKENRSRQESAGQHSVSLLEKDTEMRTFLAKQGMSLRKVPPRDRTIVLKRVINQNNASENHRVFDTVHPSFVELGKKVVRRLNIDFAGIDIIAPDITRPADGQAFIMNDINTTPGLHHHYLLADTSLDRDIGEIVMRYILFGDTSGT